MLDLYRYFIYVDTHCHMRLSGGGAKVINGNYFRILTVNHLWPRNSTDVLCVIYL